ncbi:hypothetical protein JZ751_004170, partial [Albula glossodonta]
LIGRAEAHKWKVPLLFVQSHFLFNGADVRSDCSNGSAQNCHSQPDKGTLTDTDPAGRLRDLGRLPGWALPPPPGDLTISPAGVLRLSGVTALIRGLEAPWCANFSLCPLATAWTQGHHPYEVEGEAGLGLGLGQGAATGMAAGGTVLGSAPPFTACRIGAASAGSIGPLTSRVKFRAGSSAAPASKPPPRNAPPPPRTPKSALPLSHAHPQTALAAAHVTPPAPSRRGRRNENKTVPSSCRSGKKSLRAAGLSWLRLGNEEHPEQLNRLPERWQQRTREEQEPALLSPTWGSHAAQINPAADKPTGPSRAAPPRPPLYRRVWDQSQLTATVLYWRDPPWLKPVSEGWVWQVACVADLTISTWNQECPGKGGGGGWARGGSQGWSGSDPSPDAQPTEPEREVWDQVNVVLKDARGILDDLQDYKGAGEEIREAIQNPSDEGLQEKAWGAVVPLVGKLKKFYEFSQRLEAALHSLLRALTSTRYSPTEHLEREQALAKQFAEILHFTLRFDELKARPLPRLMKGGVGGGLVREGAEYPILTPNVLTPPLHPRAHHYLPTQVSPSVADPFIHPPQVPPPDHPPHPLPAMPWHPKATFREAPSIKVHRVRPSEKKRRKMTNPAIQNDFSYYRRTLNRMRINNVPNKNLPIENTTDCLSTMASVCKVMLETPEYRSRFASEETASFCLNVMVGVIILYDYVHPVGAFAKSSKIDMKGCIKVLRDQPPNSVEGLLNALR